MASLPKFTPLPDVAPEALPPQRAPRPPLALVPPAREPAERQPLDMDLPPSLIRMMVGGFAGFMGLMAFTFHAGDGMGLALAICLVCLVGYFGLPYALSRAAPRIKERRSLQQLMRRGVALPDGQCGGGEAAGLVMLLPCILLLWAVFVGAMHALLF